MTDETARFQERVHEWMLHAFDERTASDLKLRGYRFVEEALELAQASGMTAADVAKLVGYVYGRPAGVVGQEVGGVLITLAALCTAFGLSMSSCGAEELIRINSKVAEIRAKQAGKPRP